MNPRPTREYIKVFYPAFFYDYGIEEDRGRLGFREKIGKFVNFSKLYGELAIREKVGIFRRCCPKARRLLDVGCARAIFLNQARELGWSVIGGEISKAMSEYV